MANNCYYEMKIRGKKENIGRFIDYLAADYEYYDMNPETKEFEKIPVPRISVMRKGGEREMVDHHIGYRTFSADVGDIETHRDGKTTAYVSGDVAWSIRSAWLDLRDKNEYALTVAEACKLLGVETEIFSCESGFEFSEHYYIDDSGRILFEDCCDYFCIYTEEYESFEDMKRDFEENKWKVPDGITKEIFDKSKMECDYIEICGNFLDKYDSMSGWKYSFIM